MIKPNEDNEILLKISILCGYNQHHLYLLNAYTWILMYGNSYSHSAYHFEKWQFSDILSIAKLV